MNVWGARSDVQPSSDCYLAWNFSRQNYEKRLEDSVMAVPCQVAF